MLIKKQHYIGHFLLYLSLIATVLSLTALPLYSQCPNVHTCTTNITTTSSSPYTANTGDTICISGAANYTGTLTLAGGVVINCANNPQNFTLNTIGPNAGTFFNYGTYAYSFGALIDDGLVTENYGVINLNSTLNIDASAIFNNNPGGELHVLTYISCAGQLNNSGLITTGSYLYVNGTSSLLNNSGIINLTTDFSPQNTWSNSGKINITGNFNSGVSSVGTINGGCITANNASLFGEINGATCGNIIIQNNSTLNLGFDLTGTLAVVDQTPPGSAPFIDTNLGATIGSNVQWTSCVDCNVEIPGNLLDDNYDGRTDEPYPGGVETALKLWLRGDAGTTPASGAGAMVSWTDQSANGYQATPDGGGNDPPERNDNAINFNPGVFFDGAYSDMESDGLMLGSDYIYSNNDGIQIFAVVKPDSGGGTRNYVVDFGHHDLNGYGFSYSNTNAYAYGIGDEIVTSSHSEDEVSSLLEMNMDFANQLRLFRNGAAMSTTLLGATGVSASNINFANNYNSVASNYGPFSIGRKSSTTDLASSGGQIFAGDIAEIIVFDDLISSTEKERVNSYLAIKYGITLNHDYVSSNGASLKSVTDGFGHRITGLGRDDASGLYQKQSLSDESEAIVTMYFDNYASTNQANTFSIPNDESFVLIGDDNGSLNTDWSNPLINETYIPSNRTWKVNRHNSTDIVRLLINVDHPDFDLPPIPANANASYYLILDDDGDFSSGVNSFPSMTPDGNGNFIGYSSPAFEYFKIAIRLKENCNNNIDDDGDGATDCTDSDCDCCQAQAPTLSKQ